MNNNDKTMTFSVHILKVGHKLDTPQVSIIPLTSNLTKEV